MIYVWRCFWFGIISLLLFFRTLYLFKLYHFIKSIEDEETFIDGINLKQFLCLLLNKLIYVRRESCVLDNRWPLGSPAATMATDFLGRKRGIAYVMVHTHSSDSRYILNARSMITKMYHIDLFFSGSLCDLLEKKKNVYIFCFSFIRIVQNLRRWLKLLT